MSVLGIDLGTTNTVAAIKGQPLSISAEDGRETLPSVVSFVPSGSVQVGLPAKRRRGIDPSNTIHSSKRIMGRRWSDATFQEFKERNAFNLVELEGDNVAFSTRAGVFTPSDIASIILAVTVEQTKDAPMGFDRITITVPAAFTSAQERETLAAAKGAGLEDFKLISEPMATAYAYGNVCNPVSRAGVYDLGGGTFEFSIVEWTRGVPELIACESDLLLGGDDVDQCLAQQVVEQVLAEYNWDLRNYSEVYARLVAECERAKIRLCFFEETTVDLHTVDPELPSGAHEFVLQTDVLDQIGEDLVRRSFATCDRALGMAGVRPADVDAIFLAGGSTHLKKVQSGVKAYFGQPGRFELEPTTVVAIGASQVPW
ncbi:MAG: Hsp70 family protein [Deltaproteobacteria bacterium]|nr:Hsp70 family protein [Deltaproteobacteria bacterium]